MNAPYFDHEKLRVYQEALRFNVWLSAVLEDIPATNSVWRQLDRAAGSIMLNIAEGNGKFTAADRCRFFDIARGSALECAAGLDLCAARGLLSQDGVQEGKNILREIVRMLVGLIKHTSDTRLYEDSALYEPGDVED